MIKKYPKFLLKKNAFYIEIVQTNKIFTELSYFLHLLISQ